MPRKVTRAQLALVLACVAAAGAVAGLALGRGSTSGSPFEVTAKFQKGLASFGWPQIDGVSGYALLYDGSQVAVAGPGATSTRFSVGTGQHTLTVQPLWTPATTSTSTTTTTSTTPSSSRPFGVIRLGNTLTAATGYDRYGVVIGNASDAASVAALPPTTKRLVYMSAVDSASWFDGVSQTEAIANGWTLAPEAAAGEYLLDPGNAGYRQAFITEVSAFLRAHPGVDGFYMDDVVVDPRSLTACGCWPAKYPNGLGWATAMQQFVQVTGDALKSQGWFVGANAIAYFPGNVNAWPGTNSDNGTSDQEWARELAPHLSFLMAEQFERPNGLHRTDQTTAYPGYWPGYLQVEDVVNAAGADFYATVNVNAGSDSEILYGYGSLLLDWNGSSGGVLVFGGGDPWNGSTWSRAPGSPLEAKIKVGNVWRRRFANFTVYVNATLAAQTADGHTLAASSALFVP